MNDYMPKEGTALRELGKRLADLLDEDQWTECERLMLEAHKAAKQRELELLAVIYRIKDAIYRAEIHSGMLRIIEAFNIEPSQALREHEAGVLEEAAVEFETMFYDGTQEARELRRMAEERRKK